MPAVGERVILARDLPEALDALAEQPERLPLCGGTDAYADSGPAGAPPWGFVSLRRVPELQGIGQDAGRVRIGAAVTAAELLTDPLIASELPILAQAARALGTRQIRTRASVGGNICTDRADHTLVPVLLALDAQVETAGPGGTATVPLAEHLARWAAGSSQRTDLVTAITVQPVDGYQQFARVGARNGPCYATVSAALVVDPAGQRANLALGNAAPTTVRAASAEDYAAQAVDWDSRTATPDVCEEFGRQAAQDSSPVTDPVASAQYRSHAVGVIAKRLLENAAAAGLAGPEEDR